MSGRNYISGASLIATTSVNRSDGHGRGPRDCRPRVEADLTVDTEYKGRRAEWNETSTGWLNLMIPALHAHAVRVANGDVGVLDVNVETDEMQGVLSGGMAVDKTTPRWQPLANFVAMIEPALGPETARRWARVIAKMNPTRDLALFLHNEPDARGRWYSRFVIVPGDIPTVH